MTVPQANYPYALGGLQNGRYRQSLAASQSGALNAAYTPNVGTYGSLAGANAYTTSAPAVEDAGIRAGEITAYRVWNVGKGGLLHSVYIEDHVWRPRQIVKADRVKASYGEGVHAFKSMDRAVVEYGLSSCDRVFGEIKIWGDVVEFEYGWKAEFAAITALSFIRSWGKDVSSKRVRWFSRKTKIGELRKLYGVDAVDNLPISTK
jgi:hypothetical protein